MATTKISQLPAASAVVATDLVPIVDDPSGTPVTQRATWTQVRDYILGISGGAVNVSENVAITGATVTVTNANAAFAIYPTSGTYTGAGIQSIATRASSTAFDHFYATSNSVVMFRVRGDGSIIGTNGLTMVDGGSGVRVTLPGLPTSAPGTSGSVWNNAGVLNIVP